MPDIAHDEFWDHYQSIAQKHAKTMQARVEATQAVAHSGSEQALENWDTAHREEDRSYEELKAAERVL